MKLFILSGFFLICFCFSNILIGQNFHGLAQGSSWIHQWDNSAWGGETVFEEITIGADTLINSQTYYKVKSDYDSWINYMGAVRNDTASNQVKIIPNDSLTEYTLYDYGLSIGDTAFNIYYNNRNLPEFGVLDNFRILDIDSFAIDAEYYNRYTIENLDAPPGQVIDYWYEGFGSYDGILGSDAFATLSDYRRLICCNVNGTSYDVSLGPSTIIESSSSCILNVIDIEEEESNINVYPNPSTGEIYISMSERYQTSGLYQLKIYSIDGELVSSFSNQSYGGLNKVNLDSLHAGMYILRFQFDNGIIYSHRTIKK